MDRDRGGIVAMAIASLSDVLAELSPGASAPTEQTPLLGEGSDLDSLGLVMFVVGLEQRLRDASIELTLADALILPHGENPFGTIASLADYIRARSAPPPARSA